MSVKSQLITLIKWLHEIGPTQRRKFIKALEDGLCCHYCKAPLLFELSKINSRRAMTYDHKIPKSKGGSNAPENIVSACKQCNCKKGSRDYAEFKGSMAA